MKIKDALVSVVLVGLILTFTYCAFLKQPTDPIRYENFERIQVGMSRAEVTELLGPGPCEHVNGVTFYNLCYYSGPDASIVWQGECKRINIIFVNDRVESKSIEQREIASESWIDCFRRSLGLRGRADTTWTNWVQP